MRKVAITIALLCAAAFAQQKGTFKDPRDGKSYKTVKIGTQTWMAQNMNYLPETAAPPAAGQAPAAAAKIGGYGLEVVAGTGAFTSSINSVDPGEEFDIQYQFKNTAKEEMPGGTRGAALIGSKGEIVAIIGSDGFGKMPPGFQDNKPTKIKGKIPAGIARGKYSLRPVIQRQGETEWRIAIGPKYSMYQDQVRVFLVGMKTSPWCYEGDLANCAKYGALYEFEGAKTACPSGWHLPSSEEWDKLTETAKLNNKQKICETNMFGKKECYVREFLDPKKLKAKSGWGKHGGGNGTDNFGFSAMPSGNTQVTIHGRIFTDLGEGTTWWSSASGLQITGDGLLGRSPTTGDGFSVRCVQD